MTTSKITITEALAEANNEKLIDKKIKAETEFVAQFVWRIQALADRLADQGGEAKQVRSKMQSINDLFERKIKLLAAIKRANADNSIVINGTTRTIEEWLLWKQYAAPARIKYLQAIVRKIDEGRQTSQKQGGAMVDVKVASTEYSPNVIVNVDEVALRDELTNIQVILDTLDGQLSLKNATIKIEV